MNNLNPTPQPEDIDVLLKSAPQRYVREAVKSLPEESVSMAWRSTLNERLIAEAAQRRRQKRIVWFLRPALGLGLACTLAVLIMVRTPSRVTPATPATPAGPTLEAALVTTHRQSAYAWDVAGVGLSPTDAMYDSEPAPTVHVGNSSPWNDDDLDNL